MLIVQGNEYSNHFLENGVLYRGEMTKAVVRPNKDGLYNIRYQRENFFYTKEELLDPRKPKPTITTERKNYYTPRAPRVTKMSLCRDYKIDISSYYKRLKLLGLDNATMNIADHKIQIPAYREFLDDKKKNCITNICKRFDVKYSSYRDHLKSSGIEYSDLTAIAHETHVKAYRDKCVLKRGGNVPFMCECFGVDYDQYRLRLAKLKIKYENISDRGHKYQIKAFSKYLAKKNK